MTNGNEIPDYDQDDTFDENIDDNALIIFASLLGATIGAALAAAGLAIYYFIKINFLN